MRLNEAIPQFLLWLLNEKGYREATFINQEHHIRYFMQWFDGNRKVTEITTDTIANYRIHLRTQISQKTNLPYLPSTIEEKIKTIRNFLFFCRFKDIPAMIPEKVFIKRIPHMRKVSMTDGELDAILTAPDTDTDQGLRDRAIMEFLYSTGCRLSEVVSIRRDQIDWDKQQVRLKGKGGTVRTVFLNMRTIAWLNLYLKSRKDDHPALFTHTRKRNFRSTGWMGKRSVFDLVKKYAKQRHLHHQISPHTFRHTFGTDLLKKGASPYEVKELMGHASFRSTEFYLHLSMDDVKDVHKNLMN